MELILLGKKEKLAYYGDNATGSFLGCSRYLPGTLLEAGKVRMLLAECFTFNIH